MRIIWERIDCHAEECSVALLCNYEVLRPIVAFGYKLNLKNHDYKYSNYINKIFEIKTHFTVKQIFLQPNRVTKWSQKSESNIVLTYNHVNHMNCYICHLS
jgi:hypothetical protein